MCFKMAVEFTCSYFLSIFSWHHFTLKYISRDHSKDAKIFYEKLFLLISYSIQKQLRQDHQKLAILATPVDADHFGVALNVE